MHLIKIVVMGASGVGKTAIIQQFGSNNFSGLYVRTVTPVAVERTVMLENRIYQLKILDIPPILSFPQNSLEEWSGGLFIRSASAYLLVYDASNLESFQQVKALKNQIFESRTDMHNVPILIVANKHDLLSPRPPPSSSHESRERREIATIIRKWRLTQVECSAKFNFRIVHLFREITRLSNELAHTKDNTHSTHMENPLHRENCSVS